MANEDNLQRCTVRLNLADSQGTGFFVAAGYILTCAHVVASARDKDNPVQVFWKSENRNYTARVEQLYKYPSDLALLKLEGDNFNHPCVELDGTEPNLNDDLYIFGYPKDDYPQGDPATFKYEGRSYKDNILLYKLKQGQVKLGFSGSPLMKSSTGKVCGIVHLSRDTSTDLGGRAVAAEVILQKFPEIAQLNKQFHQQQSPDNNQPLSKEDRDKMNKSPLSKEDRDNLKKFLLDNTLADSADKIKTLCRNLDIFEIARRRNLTKKEEYDFVTDLVEWLHDTYNQKALNNLCEEIKPYCTNETLLNILLNIQTKIALPTIPKIN